MAFNIKRVYINILKRIYTVYSYTRYSYVCIRIAIYFYLNITIDSYFSIHSLFVHGLYLYIPYFNWVH